MTEAASARSAAPLSAEDVPQLRDTGFGIPSSVMPRVRIDSVDLVRGIVMVLMLLDHAADFIHWGRFRFDPADLSQTTVPLFLTRWVTHFCAPVFVFLAGTSVYLQKIRGKTPAQLSKLLWTRGLWLIVLEFTVIKLSVFYSFDIRFFGFLQVIFATGFGMIVLAPLVRFRLSPTAIGATGAAIVALHNTLDGIRVTSWNGPPAAPPSFLEGVWHVLHQQGLIAPFGFPGPVAFVLYPVLAWVGVIMVGYAFGRVFELDAVRRRAAMIRLGLGMTAAFVVIRAINFYGDPSQWSTQKSVALTLLSFINTTKYPPSLLFLLMTLGPAIAFLGWLDGKRTGAIGNFFVVFGRVPLFFYVLQWQVAHLAGIALVLAFQGGVGLRRLLVSPIDWFSVTPPRGFDLWVVYLVWIAGVALLYPLCKWFAGVKARRKDWWLSYL
jgi:uncharacterized membrane protein